MSTVRLNKIRTTGGKDLLLQAGSVVNVSETRYSTAVAMSFGPFGTIWQGTIPKIYESSNTDLLVYAQVNGRYGYSGQCGTYLQIGDTGTSGILATENTRDYGFVYEYSPWGVQEVPIWGMNLYKNIPAGNIPFTFGWHAQDNGAGNGPFYTLNAGAGTHDARARASNSKIIVYEITKLS